MFTGIIERVGAVASLDRRGDGAGLTIRAPEMAPALAPGQSIAVNGCCLTVVEADSDVFAADLSGETLRRTSFDELKPGVRVNLERPLTAGKELGGHFVQGHVDGVGRIVRLAPQGQDWRLSVRVPEELGRYVAMKGSIAIDGISLTVAGWQDGVAGLAIIPYTYAHTNLSGASVGDPVNVECDILAKYVERLMESRSGAAASQLTIAELVEEGF
ncbi:MAG TPA: riboflavin synthase [Candidatus Acidoferrales bacterium]|jgi:riboflavin synthase|nr:riboflavin synthase [Candidatus Acidoferrales bacterium]